MSIKSIAKRVSRQVATAPYSNRIEKLQQYLYQQDVDLLAHDPLITLGDEELEMLDRLRATFNILVDNSEIEAARKIEYLYNISYRQARNYIIHCKNLFSQNIGNNKQADRAIQIARRESEIQAIKDDKRIDSLDKRKLIDKHYENIEKIKMLDKEDTMSMDELKRFLTIPIPVRSSNPKFLEELDDAEIID